MRNSAFGAILVLSLWTGSSSAQTSPGTKQGTQATDQDYAALQHARYLGGRVVSVDASGKKLTLHVEIPHLEPNPNYRRPNIRVQVGNNNAASSYHRQMQQLMHRYQQAMHDRNPVQREQQLMQLSMQAQNIEAQALMQAMAQSQRQEQQVLQQIARNNTPNNQPYKVRTEAKDFDLSLADPVTVRKLFMPVEFDDMGFEKTYSKEDLAALRGTDKTQPGYAAKLDELREGQEVVVYLHQAQTKKKAEKSPAGETASEQLQSTSVSTSTPSAQPAVSVNMIVMTRDMRVSSNSTSKTRKK